MTQSSSIETYYSMDADKELLTVQWVGIRDRGDLWRLLMRILGALASMPEQLGELSGRLAIDDPRASGDVDTLEREELQLVLDAEGLRRLGSLHLGGERANGMVPDSLVLRTNATILLPETVREVRVVAFDFEELEDRGPLPLRPLALSGCPEGFRAWQTLADPDAFEEEAPLYLEIMCVLNQWEQRIFLTLHGCFDVWHAERFDGQPNEIGRVNLQRWKDVLQHLVDETGGAGRLAGGSPRAARQ